MCRKHALRPLARAALISLAGLASGSSAYAQLAEGEEPPGLTSSWRLGTVYDSNPAMRAKDPQGAFRYSITPTYSYLHTSDEGSKLQALGQLRLERSSDPSVSSNRHDGHLGLNIQHQWETDIAAWGADYQRQATQDNETLSNSDGSETTSQTTTRTTRALQAKWIHVLGLRSSVNNQLAFRDVSFDRPALTNYRFTQFDSSYSYLLSERLTAVGAVMLGRYSPSASANIQTQASTIGNVGGGLRYHFTPSFEALVRGGLAYISSGTDKGTSPSAQMDLRYSGERLSYSLQAARISSPSAFGTVSTQSQLQLSADYALSGRSRMGASAGANTYSSGSSGSSQQWRSWFSYELDENWSTRVDYQFRHNRNAERENAYSNQLGLSLIYSNFTP